MGRHTSVNNRRLCSDTQAWSVGRRSLWIELAKDGAPCSGIHSVGFLCPREHSRPHLRQQYRGTHRIARLGLCKELRLKEHSDDP